mmetsp:Transcript_72243/g.199226  ORF Transcript_72243/g.199226 Transcript_72243/m.199226 type:complete len:764 (+) Transcript_72243:84-2375(+)
MTGPGPPKATGDLRRTSTTSTQVPQNLDPDRIARMQTVGGRIGKPVEFAGKYAVELDEEDEPQEDQAVRTGRKFILTDECWAKHAWTVIVMVLLAYTATIFLYRFTFVEFQVGADIKIGVGWTIVGWIVDCLFWLDLVLNFFLSYKDQRGNEVDSLRLIAWKYGLGFFWVNLVACVPEALIEGSIYAIAETTDDDQGAPGVNKFARVVRIQRVSRLAKLVRLSRVAKCFSFIQSNEYWKELQNFSIVRIVNFIVGLFWSLHLLACFWYLAAALHDDPEETWVGNRVNADGTSLLNSGPFQQWLTSMYFVLTVFTTVGFGDIAAITEVEIGCVAFIMIAGAVVHSIIISEVIQVVTSTDQVQQFIDKQIKLIDAFSEHTELTPLIQKRLKGEIAWRAKMYSMHKSYDKEEITQLILSRYIPWSIIEEMPANIFQGRLVKNRFLSCCEGVTLLPPRFPLLLAVHLSRVEFSAGEVVYQMHDFPFSIFLVLSGTFACIARPTPTGGMDEVYVREIDHDVAMTPMSKTVTWDPGTSMTGGLMGRIKSTVSRSCSMRTEPTMVPSTTQSSSFYPYRLFSVGNYFGEVEILLGRPRLATVRCERAGAALVLAKQDLLKLQEQFPQCRGVWESVARRREQLRQRACKQLRVGLTIRHFAAVRVQRYFRWWQRYQPLHHCQKLHDTGQRDAEDAMVEFMQCHAGRVRALSDEQTRPMRPDEEWRRSVEGLRAEFQVFRSEILTILQGRAPDELGRENSAPREPGRERVEAL